MSERLEIRTLGGLSIQVGGQPVTGFDQRKVPALLVYLACNPRPHPREMLSEMLWEGRTQSQSQSNLRVVLTDLRRTVGRFVDITPETVGVNTAGEVYLDAEDFDRRLADRKDEDPHQIDDALDLYRGDFLEGFTVDSPGFEAWVLLERERLHFRALEALDRVIDGHLQRTNYARGIACATRLLHLDALREKTYRQLMELLALSGEREAALAEYETCRQVLHQELRVAPTPETTTLYEQIRDGLFVRERPSAAEHVETVYVQERPVRPRHNLPVQTTSFVGREFDIAAISEHLNHPDCRLLTLVGPGGIGKTRLALAAAEYIRDNYRDGVCFVPLAPVQFAEGVVQAIAVALQLQAEKGPIEPQLLNYLRDKHLLLLLDNVEHLLAEGRLVDAMLSHAPHVQVLATSRAPLSLGWEWLYEVQGMPYPTTADTTSLENYSAIRLFVERARRVQPGFRLDVESEYVIRICQHVGGMPLGIEIAAAWVRMLPCRAIGAALLDLELPQRDAPERHRSLRLLFDYTWQQLSPKEQEVFRRLSVMMGSFTLEAAQAIGNASLPVLARLVNQSLVRYVHDTQRFEIHELLRQYAGECLNEIPEEREHACSRHCTFYLGFLTARRDDMLGPRQVEALEEVAAEMDNIYTAWDWAVAQRKATEIGMTVESFFWFHASLELVNASFRKALQAFETDVPAGEQELLTARLWAWGIAFEQPTPELVQNQINEMEQHLSVLRRYADARSDLAFALVHSWQLSPDTAEEHLAESLAIFRELGDKHGTAYCLFKCGHYYLGTTRFAQAEPYYHESIQLASELNNYWLQALCWTHLGIIAIGMFQNEEAIRRYQKSNLLLEHVGNHRVMAINLNNMSLSWTQLGNYWEAERYAQECRTLYQELGFSDEGERCYLSCMGFVRCAEADYPAARDFYEQLASLDPWLARVEAFEMSGRVDMKVGNYPSARRNFKWALELAAENKYFWMILNSAAGLAYLCAAESDFQTALELYGISASHPNIDFYVQDALELRARIEAEFDPETIAAAIERGKDRDLLEVAHEMLALLEQSG